MCNDTSALRQDNLHAIKMHEALRFFVVFVSYIAWVTVLQSSEIYNHVFPLISFPICHNNDEMRMRSKRSNLYMRPPEGPRSKTLHDYSRLLMCKLMTLIASHRWHHDTTCPHHALHSSEKNKSSNTIKKLFDQGPTCELQIFGMHCMQQIK